MSEKKRLKITNISGQKSPPHGKILDYHGSVIANGKYAIVSVDGVDEILENWHAAGLVKIQDAASGEMLLGGSPSSISVGTRVQEATATDFEEFGDEDELNFDPSSAQEAVLVKGSEAIAGDLTQNSGGNQYQPKVKISLGTESERLNADDMSPIPGETVREVGSASNFTIKAKPAPSGPAGR
jgi:hypothetical protein